MQVRSPDVVSVLRADGEGAPGWSFESNLCDDNGNSRNPREMKCAPALGAFSSWRAPARCSRRSLPLALTRRRPLRVIFQRFSPPSKNRPRRRRPKLRETHSLCVLRRELLVLPSHVEGAAGLRKGRAAGALGAGGVSEGQFGGTRRGGDALARPGGGLARERGRLPRGDLRRRDRARKERALRAVRGEHQADGALRRAGDAGPGVEGQSRKDTGEARHAAPLAAAGDHRAPRAEDR